MEENKLEMLDQGYDEKDKKDDASLSAKIGAFVGCISVGVIMGCLAAICVALTVRLIQFMF